jgi:NitT/TauT family transport system permease protein
MVFPVVFTNVQAGITAVDPELLEMTEVYRVDRGRVLRYLYLPSILPFLLSGIQTGLGLTWKVVVAAEVLSEPRFGIGASLSDARILLDTPRVFAWTAVAILLSAATDALFGAIRRGRRL